MRDEDHIAEVNCQFCNKNYKVDLNELLKKWPASDEKPAGLKTPEKTRKKISKKCLTFLLVVSYNNIRRPERATEQNLSNMRP